MKTPKIYVQCVNADKAVASKKLAELLNGQLITTKTKLDFDKDTEVPVVINYGRSVVPSCYNRVIHSGGLFINHPDNIKKAIDKETTFESLKGHVSIPSYTRSASQAASWLKHPPNLMYVRTITTGKGGKGIKIVTNKKDLAQYDGMLMTHGVKLDTEFRAHVVDGKCVELIQKKRMGKAKLAKFGLTEADELIRSYKRGWVFAKKNLAYTPSQRDYIKKVGVSAVNRLGLDYGAVDIGVRAINSISIPIQPIILEVNTAPGLRSLVTANIYVNSFNKLIESHMQQITTGLFDVPGAEIFV